MLSIVAATAVVFVIDLMDTTRMFLPFLQFSPDAIFSGQIWRLITWALIPMNPRDLLLTGLTLYFYYFIGTTLEREWGAGRFTIYYLSGVALHVIFGFAVWALGLADAWTLQFMGSHYLNLSMFFAFATLFPDQVIRLFFIIPIKIKWLALADAVFFVYSIYQGFAIGAYAIALLPVVAILNFLLICGGDLLALLRRARRRNTQNVVNFRQATREAARQRLQKDEPRHTCSVCGRTDIKDPGLEFRYCSRCEGYHCFCTDHINNHVHFQ
jgi:membrane associated rhomboid family serine protease